MCKGLNVGSGICWRILSRFFKWEVMLWEWLAVTGYGLNQREFYNISDWALPQPIKSESLRRDSGGPGILKLLEDSSTGVRTADGRHCKHNPGVWDFHLESCDGH